MSQSRTRPQVLLLLTLLAACDGTTDRPRSEVDVSRQPIYAGSPHKLQRLGDPEPRTYPFDQVAAIYEMPSDGHCTCFKAINEFTCLSAAHCFFDCKVTPAVARYDGLMKQLPFIEFKAGDSGPHPVIPGTDYGVIIPKAFWNACAAVPKQFLMQSQDDVAVIRFRGKIGAGFPDALYMGNTDPNVPADQRAGSRFIPDRDVPAGDYDVEVAGYPDPPFRYGDPVKFMPAYAFTPAVAGWTYPGLGWGRGKGRFIAAIPQFIVHDVSTAGGHSGSPVLIFDALAASQYQVIGVHRGRMVTDVGKNNAVKLDAARVAWIKKVAGY